MTFTCITCARLSQDDVCLTLVHFRCDLRAAKINKELREPREKSSKNPQLW